MLEGSQVELGVDYFEFKKLHPDIAEKTIYTGMIDEYFDFKLGHLEYRTVRFETEVLDTDNYQGNSCKLYRKRSILTQELLNTSILNLEISQRRLFQKNIHQNGSRELNHIIQLMMKQMESYLNSTKSWQIKKKM